MQRPEKAAPAPLTYDALKDRVARIEGKLERLDELDTEAHRSGFYNDQALVTQRGKIAGMKKALSDVWLSHSRIIDQAYAELKKNPLNMTCIERVQRVLAFAEAQLEIAESVPDIMLRDGATVIRRAKVSNQKWN